MAKKHKFLSSKTRKLLEELDWDCADQYHQRSSLNIIHWHPASFITAIPSNVIDIFSEQGDVVWDPFCGSGTTAVEAFRKGRCFYGSDVSQIAILISRAKINVLRYRDYFSRALIKLDWQLQPNGIGIHGKQNEKEFWDIGLGICSYNELAPWYNPEVLNKLVWLWGFLQEYKTDPILMPIFSCVFLNIAKIACAQQKTWGHVADNVRPTLQQVQTRKILVIESYLSRLRQIRDRANKVFLLSQTSSYYLESADARQYRPREAVDLVITSPPYPAMADYITSQRLAYYWLGFDGNYLNSLKTKEIGARYLRHNKSKNLKYFGDMASSLTNIISCIRSGGVLAIMLPDYQPKDERKETIDSLCEFLQTRLIPLFTINRNVDEMNRWAPFRKLKNENLIIWSKP